MAVAKLRQHQIADPSRLRVGDHALEPLPDRDVDLSGVGRVGLLGHQQHNEPGVPPRITDVRPGADAPPADDIDTDFIGRIVADGRKGDHRDLGAGGRPEAREEVFHGGGGAGVDHRRKVVDETDRLRGEERVDPGILGRQPGHDHQL